MYNPIMFLICMFKWSSSTCIFRYPLNKNTCHGNTILKVSKSQKQILKFSFASENERKYFSMSALAYKKRSNQKTSVKKSK